MEKNNYPIINRVYKHYKGGCYKVISLAINASNKGKSEEIVVYKSVEFGTIYTRPLSEWNESIEIKDELASMFGDKVIFKNIPRFELI